MTTRVTLTYLDGNPPSRQSFYDDGVQHAWAWVADVVAEEYDCEPDDVGCTDDDIVTAAGVPVARVSKIYCALVDN